MAPNKSTTLRTTTVTGVASQWSTPFRLSTSPQTTSPISMTSVIVPIVTGVCIVIVIAVLIQQYRRKHASTNLHNTASVELSNGVPLAYPSEKVVISHEESLTSQPLEQVAVRPKHFLNHKGKTNSGEFNPVQRRQRTGPDSYVAQRHLTVSQYIDPSLLPTDPFVRFDPNRRSNSLGSLPPLMKMNTMSSQDSGFASQMSLLGSPGSAAPSIYVTDSSSCQVAANSLYIKKLIEDAVKGYYAMPNRVRGVCYASRVFAIGEFDSSGGSLFLEGCNQVRLEIPPGALQSSQVVYFMMQFENNDPADSTVNYSPTFECGPDGLEFNVPVELTFPHTAVDTEVTALSREGNSVWSETNVDGPEISAATPDTVTLKIHHFTGFKLSASKEPLRHGLYRACRSRIPVRDQSTVSIRRPSISQPGKRLLVSIFKSGDKARIYFINSMRSTNFDRMIDQQEASLQFAKDSPWKDFTYWCGKGGLVIESAVITGTNRKLFRRFTFNDRKVLTANYEYVEIVSPDKVLLLDITLYQPQDKNNSTQFSIKLEKLSSPMEPSVSEEYRQQIHFQQLTSLMSNLRLCRAPPCNSTQDGCQSSTLLVPNRPYDRSISDITKNCSVRQPQEHCEHDGACNCWKEGPRSPVESECNASLTQSEGMRRGGVNRRSKESGYGSSVQSPVSPLKGPDSLSVDDSMANEAGSTSDLTLRTITTDSWTPHNNNDFVQRTDI